MMINIIKNKEREGFRFIKRSVHHCDYGFETQICLVDIMHRHISYPRERDCCLSSKEIEYESFGGTLFSLSPLIEEKDIDLFFMCYPSLTKSLEALDKAAEISKSQAIAVWFEGGDKWI